MKRTKSLSLIFCLIVIGVFLYSAFLGKRLPTISTINFQQVKEVIVKQDHAGFEGFDDSNAYDVNAMYDEDANTYDKLYQASDLIAVIKLKDRKQEMNTICSNMEVLNVYKGDSTLKKSDIEIYEPMGFDNINQLNIFGACLPIREDQTYIVFLKEEINKRYNYVSALYGKYNVKNDSYIKVKNDQLSVEDMMNNDMVEFEFNNEMKDKLVMQLKEDGESDEDIKDKLTGYQRLANLKACRESIRTSFNQLIKNIE